MFQILMVKEEFGDSMAELKHHDHALLLIIREIKLRLRHVNMQG